MTSSTNHRALTRRAFLRLAGLSTILAACGEPETIVQSTASWYAVCGPSRKPRYHVLWQIQCTISCGVALIHCGQ
jgi:hypothetical protein